LLFPTTAAAVTNHRKRKWRKIRTGNKKGAQVGNEKCQVSDLLCHDAEAAEMPALQFIPFRYRQQLEQDNFGYRHEQASNSHAYGVCTFL